ncbi:hypothetical protein BE21_53270 [Sorangium cellulosum]|uniref:Uncharacterized protein n=1 Tax=Sorangium cellulosum TaxID=56 RepID=A0A150TEI6_SORCE|nr:hypothetical protein BE21_53270 [Sorangium cellulosum]
MASLGSRRSSRVSAGWTAPGCVERSPQSSVAAMPCSIPPSHLISGERRSDAPWPIRLAFGEVVDVRVARRGAIGRSTSVDRQLGSPRVQAYLARRRVSRVMSLAQAGLDPVGDLPIEE